MKESTPVISAAYEEIDRLLQDAFPPDGPGASAIIVQGGEVLLRRGYGLANVEWQIPAAPDTVFRIGSVTKQFTAVAVMMLEEQGKLTLQDPLEKFLPDYPTHGHTITVEHLLNHTSGIKGYTEMSSWMADWGKNFTLEELIDYFKYQPMEFAPGKQWNYNNSGYVLLGAVVEKVAGVSYGEFLRKEIFTPLGMHSTCLEQPGTIIPRRAAGYSNSPDGCINAAYISMTQPLAAGGLVSTVDDLAAWESALNAGRLIPVGSLRRARTAGVLPHGGSTHYAYGWEVHDYQGYGVVEHGGGIHGFVCHALSIPSEQFFAAVLTNSDGPALAPEVVTFRAALQALGLPYPAPVEVQLTEEQLRRFVGRYQMKEGPQFEITLEDGGLWLAFPGMPEKRKMAAIANNELVDLKNPLIRNVFVEDGSGPFTGVESRNQYNKPGLKAARVMPQAEAEDEASSQGLAG